MRSLRLICAGTLLLLGLGARAQASQKIITFSKDVPLSECRYHVQRIGGTVIRELDIIHAIVASFPPSKGDIAPKGMEELEEDVYRKWIESGPETLYDVELPSVDSIINEANSSGKGNVYRPRFIIPKNKGADAEIPWGIARVNAAAAWNTTEGAGVNVAVVDTGIDLNHPDLAANIAGGYNAVDPDVQPMDDNGHGTHVAGTIAALRDNKGVAGVAPKARLYAVKVLDASGSGSYSGIIAGIEWCAKNNIKVINMSLGGPSGSSALAKAMKVAAKAGITIICAAGNDGGDVAYPASYPEAVAVSASDSADALAYFSNRGPKIEFVAPGVNVKSTYMGGRYKSLSGTSMACPHVAGLAALAIAAGASNPEAVKAALKAAAVPLPKLTVEEQGNGMIDAGKFARPGTESAK